MVKSDAITFFFIFLILFRINTSCFVNLAGYSLPDKIICVLAVMDVIRHHIHLWKKPRIRSYKMNSMHFFRQSALCRTNLMIALLRTVDILSCEDYIERKVGIMKMLSEPEYKIAKRRLIILTVHFPIIPVTAIAELHLAIAASNKGKTPFSAQVP